ncbi:kelch-like protein 3 [Ciona intestinalis]
MSADHDDTDSNGESDFEEDDHYDESFKVMKSDEYIGAMLKQLNSQRMNNIYCDFTICVGGKEYPVHQNILATRSEYFKTMFNSKMKEGLDKRVEIKETSNQCMERILDFLYTGKMRFSLQTVEETIRCASLLQLHDLLWHSSEFVATVFTIENCLHFHQLAKLHSMHYLVRKTSQYVLRHFYIVSQHESWKALNVEDLETLVSSKDLMVKSEQVVYESIIGWVKHDIQTRRQHFPSLFKHVRLRSIPVNYVTEVIRKEDLLYEFRECTEVVLKHFVEMSTSIPNVPRKGYFPDMKINFVSHSHCGNFYLNKQVKVKQCNPHTKKNISALTVNKHKVYFCIPNNINYNTHDVVCYDGESWDTLVTLPQKFEVQHMVISESEHFKGKFYPQHTSNRECLFFFGRTQNNGKNQIRIWNLKSDNLENCAYSSSNCFRIGASVITSDLCSVVDIYDSDVKNPEKPWKRGNNMNVARKDFAAVNFNNRIYCFGGLDSHNIAILNGEFMNTADGVWTMLTNNIPLPIDNATACCVGDHIAVYGSSSKGRICTMNVHTEEWEVWTENEDENMLLQGKGILFTSS